MVGIPTCDRTVGADYDPTANNSMKHTGNRSSRHWPGIRGTYSYTWCQGRTRSYCSQCDPVTSQLPVHPYMIVSTSQGYCPGLSTTKTHTFLQQNLLHDYSWEWRLEQSLKNKGIKAIESAKTTLNSIWKFHHSGITKHFCTLITHCNTCVKYKAWLCPLYRMKPDPQKIKATFSKMAINFGNHGD